MAKRKDCAAAKKSRSEAARKAALARWGKTKKKKTPSKITANQRRGLRNAWTDEKREIFLKSLEECPIINRAISKIRISRSFLYKFRSENPDFAAEWDAAKDRGIDALEDEAMRRALVGTDKPIYQGGKKVGTVREFSDTLAIFLLKGNRPNKYRDRHELSGADGMPLSAGLVQIVIPDNGRGDAQPPGGGASE